MKKIGIIMAFLTGICNVFAQNQMPDTLLPKPNNQDSLPYEKKLSGGALIDTVNTKEKSHKLRPIHPEKGEKPEPVIYRDTLPPKRK